jgi:ATPase subunit of ABC transporter with duplicated ATPase domains
MISTNNLSLWFGKRALFKDVNIKFTPGNCYGLIGANGTGKSTFLKILAGEIEPTGGTVEVTPGERLAVLRQNHYEFDEFAVLKTVIMGHARLYAIMEEKDALYAKPDFSDEDGVKVAELEGEFAELNGWDAETEAAKLLNGLGIPEELHGQRMADLSGNEKVRVLLAQALFGNPDVLLLDEPTNHLNIEAIQWLEEFLYNFANTVIVVSHDRHFLNRVCTHIADIDFGKIQLYVGNYDFWLESSELALKLAKEANRKTEEKIKELQSFIQRFSANASKSRQATSRKKLLEKLTLEDIRPSSRKYPYIAFKPDREAGDQLLTVEGLGKAIDGEAVLDGFSLRVERGDKIAFVGENGLAKTTLFRVLMGELPADCGEFKWGVTTSQAYFPRDNGAFFDGCGLNLVDWLRQFSRDQEETFIRGFLGRMLFSGEESLKEAQVLSGGEKVRCMLTKMMLSGANVLIFDEPTNHLDLESITALNNGLIAFGGTILFASHDHQFVQTVANRIVEITPAGVIDRRMSYDEYLEQRSGLLPR